MNKPFYGMAEVIFSPPVEGLTYLEVVVGTTMYTFTRLFQKVPKRGRPKIGYPTPMVVSLTITCNSEVVDWVVPDMIVLMNDTYLKEYCPSITTWDYKMYLVRNGCREAEPIATLIKGSGWVQKFTEIAL